MKPQLFMVFDVESVGLHGEGFAVGWVVVDDMGQCRETAGFACNPDRAAGLRANREWIAENVHLPVTAGSPREVRALFWQAWMRWKQDGALLAADVAWPVEARFLNACIEDREPGQREWDGPYPLIDIASVRLAAGYDPLATEDRLADELPAHDPLADARQSARLLLQALSSAKAVSA